MRDTKRLQLRYLDMETAEVIAVTRIGIQEYERCIGTVHLNRVGHSWRARDVSGRNHGDSYTTKWNAAKQLALGQGMGEYSQ